jgi:hypothetical protein
VIASVFLYVLGCPMGATCCAILHSANRQSSRYTLLGVDMEKIGTVFVCVCSDESLPIDETMKSFRSGPSGLTAIHFGGACLLGGEAAVGGASHNITLVGFTPIKCQSKLESKSCKDSCNH